MISALLELQRGLEQLYRLDPAPEIAGFLVDGSGRRAEELLIVEDDDLYVGVVLDQSSLVTLGAERLVDANLEAFCIAVEGVSHFLFVIHRARQNQPSTILELELQAEVDKYVASMLLIARCPTLPSERLRKLLYTNYQLYAGLSPAEQWRYHRANTLARRYAHRLEHRFVRRRRLPAMLGELRRFYRSSYHGKRAMIS